jgi:uncharacterized protein involved in high-affinity Fe2+ transport|tara:strand:- start:564 stop:1145 length:582 start_codon:yes stop_codon:yes gene_type:complete
MKIKNLDVRFSQMRIKSVMLLLGMTAISLITTSAYGAAPFREYPIGDSIERNKMEIAAVWLPPVKMNNMPNMDDLKKNKKGETIHIEADIHATEGNENGFGAGEWIPSLKVGYVLKGSNGKVIQGNLFPMVAKDGAHYGAQIFLPYGKYKLIFNIAPPNSMEFGRHTDPVTGVAPWWQPFEASWNFDFKGAKK